MTSVLNTPLRTTKSPRTVAQAKMAGEREEITAEINERIVRATGRKDLTIIAGKTISVINLLKIRDVLRIIDNER